MVVMIIYSMLFLMGFSCYLVGLSFLTGFGVTIVFVIVNTCLTHLISSLQNRIAAASEARMSISSELFNNIKFIKTNVWEEYFYDKLESARGKEVGLIQKKMYVEAVMAFTMWVAPKIILATILGTYIALDGLLTPAVAFGISCVFAYL